MSFGLPAVCRLGLATRGGSHLRPEDVLWAVDRGVNYLNWCGHPDGMSRAIASLKSRRRDLMIAVQLEARSAEDAEREFASMLEELQTGYIDVATLYYIESRDEWEEVTSSGGAWHWLNTQKRQGRLHMIGLTTHQRRLGMEWVQSGRLDMLMARYNAAHAGAERDVLPAAAVAGIPVVTFTGLRWRALLEPSPAAAPSAADCYRFCLSHPDVAVALAAPDNERQLRDSLTLLDDWRPLNEEEMRMMRLHGEHVRRRAGPFP